METNEQAEVANSPTPSSESVDGVDASEQDTVTEISPDDELTAAQTEANKNLQGWQRTQAEFSNYKKRTERELRESYQRASLDTLAHFLPIFDDFELALNNIPEEFQGHSWVDGVTMIQSKFEKLLENHDIEVIDPTGKAFDPNLHEAIGTDDSDDVESGHVTATLQKGYMSGDRILRVALVRVAN